MSKSIKHRINTSLDCGILSYISLTLVVICIVIFTYESTPNSYNYKAMLDVLENILLMLFLIEYILRIATSYNKVKYMFSFYGIIDILSIIPSILTFGFLDCKFLRILRLMRIFKLLNNKILNNSLLNIKKSLYNVKGELFIFTVISGIFMYLSAVGIFLFEHEAQPNNFGTILDSLWWSLISLTTVGYGDSYPITIGGKIFSSIIIFIGLGLVAIPTGIISSSFTSIIKKEKL